MSENQIVIGLTTIVVLGIGAQWIGRRLGFPSLLLLLPAGLIAGTTGLVEPDAMFGDTLSPLVTLLVALLLFHSGLNLRFGDLPRDARRPVVRLVTLGTAITFLGGSFAVSVLFPDTGHVAFLIGAILVVSGPTVVGPLLEVVLPRKPTGSILAWEGTVLDPLGATLGVVVLNLVLSPPRSDLHPVLQMFGRLGVGVTIGLIAAVLLVFVMSQFLVTDNMEAAVAVLFAVAAFGAAEVLLSEAGLFAALTMGVVAANQRLVPTARITGFGQTLEVLIIGGLFITLGALVDVADIRTYAWPTIALSAVLILVVRPTAALVSLGRSKLPWRDRGLVAWMAPRGIVAAATAAQFSTELTDGGIDADPVTPIVFGVILATGITYGLSAKGVANALRVSAPRPTGVGLVGDSSWLLGLARRLHDLGVPVLVMTAIDPSELARDYPDLPVVSLLESMHELDDAIERTPLRQVVVAASPNTVVTLVVADLVAKLSRRHVLFVPEPDEPAIGRFLPARWSPEPFEPGTSTALLDERAREGADVVVVGDSVPDGSIALAGVRPDGTVDLRPGRRRSAAEARWIALVGGHADG